jgi:hypothetical protein
LKGVGLGLEKLHGLSILSHRTFVLMSGESGDEGEAREIQEPGPAAGRCGGFVRRRPGPGCTMSAICAKDPGDSVKLLDVFIKFFDVLIKTSRSFD